jgi:hypothetical protein
MPRVLAEGDPGCAAFVEEEREQPRCIADLPGIQRPENEVDGSCFLYKNLILRFGCSNLWTSRRVGNYRKARRSCSDRPYGPVPDEIDLLLRVVKFYSRKTAGPPTLTRKNNSPFEPSTGKACRTSRSMECVKKRGSRSLSTKLRIRRA